MSIGWDEVVAFGLALPDTELSTSYGRPALKVRGKLIAATGKEPDHFVLMSTLDEIEMLKESDPACFFQTPHYEGWSSVLVRYASADRSRVLALVERAWAARASRRQRAQRESPAG